MVQALRGRLAQAVGNGDLLSSLEAAVSAVEESDNGGMMVALRTNSLNDLAAFAVGQV